MPVGMKYFLLVKKKFCYYTAPIYLLKHGEFKKEQRMVKAHIILFFSLLINLSTSLFADKILLRTPDSKHHLECDANIFYKFRTLLTTSNILPANYSAAIPNEIVFEQLSFKELTMIARIIDIFFAMEQNSDTEKIKKLRQDLVQACGIARKQKFYRKIIALVQDFASQDENTKYVTHQVMRELISKRPRNHQVDVALAVALPFVAYATARIFISIDRCMIPPLLILYATFIILTYAKSIHEDVHWIELEKRYPQITVEDLFENFEADEKVSDLSVFNDFIEGNTITYLSIAYVFALEHDNKALLDTFNDEELVKPKLRHPKQYISIFNANRLFRIAVISRYIKENYPKLSLNDRTDRIVSTLRNEEATRRIKAKFDISNTTLTEGNLISFVSLLNLHGLRLEPMAVTLFDH